MKMSSSQQISDVINTEKNNLILGNNHINISNNNNYKYNNCVAIRQEIQRFESVHPSIYAIYDLLELNSDQVLSLRIREHLLSIEDSFVNSQEWTLSRNVPDLRLGIVGSIDSGKSALVHRYLTGSYMQDESPEGGRFKKEVFVQGQSNMLLIRDEGGPPEMQFSCWVDAVIFVFSIDNLESFETVKEYYQKLVAFRNNIDQVPLFLVGTKDQENDIISSIRLIDETSGRHLAEEMHKDCHYYETCATLGQNVEKVFQDACQRIIEVRSANGLSNECSSPASSYTAIPSYLNNPVQTSQNFNTFSSLNLSRPTTPHNQNRNKPNNNNYINNCYNNNGFNRQAQSPLSTFTSNYQTSPNNSNLQSTSISLNNSLRKTIDNHQNKNKSITNHVNSNVGNLTSSKIKDQQFSSFNTPLIPKRVESKHNSVDNNQVQTNISNNFSSTLFTPISTIKEALQQNCPNQNVLPISTIIGSNNQIKTNNNTPNSNNNCTVNTTAASKNNNESNNTPSCTPNINRKTRRRSNLFSVSSSKNKNLEEKCRNGELGSGRAIPLRQGYLHKKSVNSSLNTKLSLKNKEWKKKYVTLTTDGCLTYHPSLHDYMNDSHGKKISLMHTTVKIPGQKPRGSSIISSNIPNNSVEGEFNKLNLINNTNNQNNYNEVLIDGSLGNYDNGRCVNCGIVFNNSDDRRFIPVPNSTIKDKDSSSSKKKHRRLKSNQLTNVVITTNAYCERCATLLENGNGFASTFVANNSNKNSSDSTNGHEDEDYVFVIVSLDNKQWHFQAQSAEDRENWLQAIENQILLSLQNIQSDKEKLRNSNSEQSNNEKIFKDQIRQIAGNNYCLDCDATNPTWASLNLGGLICIECSGIHRNLGTHISKVRSLDLDDWPEGNIAVMLSLGNTAVNKIWECNTKNFTKPVPTSSRDEKEMWVRRKYERKEFLCTLNDKIPINDQLENSIKSGDLRQVFNLLSHVNSNLVSSLNQINCKSSSNDNCTLLQLAVSTNNIGIAQLLIWCLGNINATDTRNFNALSYAKTKEMKDFLRSQGCTENKTNIKTTLDLNNSSIAKNLNQNLSTNNSNNFNMFDQLPTSII